MNTDRMRLYRFTARLLAVLLALALFVGATPASVTYATGPANLVVNPSFEDPQISGTFQYLSSIPGWTLAFGSAIEVQHNIWTAADGNQLIELDSNDASGVYQDIPTTPGATYHLRFAFSARPGRPLNDNKMTVSWGGEQLGSIISADGTDLSDASWAYYEFDVTASESTSRVQFSYAGTINTYGAFVDDVSVTLLSPANNSWFTAERLTLTPSEGNPQVYGADAEQFLVQQGQSAWYKFSVQPQSKLIVTLTGLPANYDLTLYKDIAAAYKTLNSPQDLVRLGAEFAPDAFAPDAFAPDAFAPDAFAPDAFAPDAFAPDAFAPDAFAPDAFAPDAFAPDAFAPDAFAPDAFAPDAFAPDAFAPDAFAPDAFAPDAFAPDAFASAQTRSLIGVSAFEGTASEGILINTWDNAGDYYVRVRGRNGAFNPDAPFHLQVLMLAGQCGSISASLPASTLTATNGNYKTIILTDMARMSGSAADKATLQARLATFAARSEVAGVIIDVGGDARVAAANTQADSNPECVFAKNLVAYSVKGIVDAYRAQNPLQYIVIIGNDNVIPFFRHPDQALLANEKNFVPPVLDSTASQAALKFGYVLSQDRYGASINLSLNDDSFPISDLAIGRLVEMPADATAMLDAYLSTSGGVVNTPTSSLVTGYDFLTDAALAIESELEAGIGHNADTLILPANLSPSDPSAWTANDLRTQLLGSRHDLIFLAGHFSASSALAADYSTRVHSTEVMNSSANLSNSIIFSAGCHAGYNIVDAHDVPGITVEPDWAQAFNRKGATLIAGTGYQYGDTDFIEYSERLYLDFSKLLRQGSGAVSIGKALMQAKQNYLADTPQMRGIHEKALLEATLFGLPMLSVNMPTGRTTAGSNNSIVTSTSGYSSDPGLTLGLRSADVTITPSFTQHTKQLADVSSPGGTVNATYLSGSAGAFANIAEPVLPLEVRNVSVSGNVLRGVGFRGGSYTDLLDILPLTGAATTEVRGVHAPFISTVLFPVQPWSVNYFNAVISSNGTTRLMVLPAQFKSNTTDSLFGTLRRFDNMHLRLFYSNNITTFPTSGNTPALAARPAIAFVFADVNGDDVHFTARVSGDPSAGIQEVWVTYTALSGSLAGQWQSLNLTQSASDSTLWEGTLVLNGLPAAQLRYMVQAVNGVGLVALSTNLGEYYAPDVDPGATSPSAAPTSLNLQSPPSTGMYANNASFNALLTSNGSPLVGQTVRFALGSLQRQATTNANGVATVNIPLLNLPGTYELGATFAGNVDYATSSDSGSFTINRQGTQLAIDPPAATIELGGSASITATLTDANGVRLREKTVFFVISGPSGAFSASTITDFSGRAKAGPFSLPVGSYNVNVYFSGAVPLPGQTLNLSDDRYLASTASGTLNIVDTTPPVTTASVAGTSVGCALGTCYVDSATVTLSTNEPATTKYRINGGAFQTYSAPFAVNTLGANTVEFFSIDQYNNTEATKSLIVKITALATGVLDNFNRANGKLGSNWSGADSQLSYRINGQKVNVNLGGAIYWDGASFGADQEAFVTLTKVDGFGLHQLLLKVQDNNHLKGSIMVFYDSVIERSGIKTFVPGQGWRILALFNTRFNDGDQMAARALADGSVQMFKNGALIGQADAGSFFAGKGGRIGLLFFLAGQAQFDDFGGGTHP